MLNWPLYLKHFWIYWLWYLFGPFQIAHASVADTLPGKAKTV
jgi:hypothetical protein